MENNIFAGGVAPGGPTTENEIKTLVCFILAKIAEPMSFSQLHSALREKALVNYFELISAVDSLKESGHVEVDEKGGLVNTLLGKETAETLATSLPFRVKEKAVEGARLVLAREVRLSEVKVVVSPLSSGGYQVDMAIPDMEGELIAFSLFAPNEEKADKLKRGFLNDPIYIYKSVMALVTGDYLLVENLKPREENLF